MVQILFRCVFLAIFSLPVICRVVHFQLLVVQMRVNGKYDRADQVAARGSVQIWRSVAR